MYPLESFVPAGRALHLIDIENLMGGPQAGRDAIPLATEGYLATVSMMPDDLIVVATNPHLWLPAKLAWPGALVLSARGRDGADRALISQVADVERIASRFDRLVIGSGDGILGLQPGITRLSASLLRWSHDRMHSLPCCVLRRTA